MQPKSSELENKISQGASDPRLWLYKHVTVKQREAGYRNTVCACVYECVHAIALYAKCFCF